MPMITLAGHDYPSLASVADADKALAGDVLRAVSWAARGDDDKKRGLVSATRMLAGLPWAAPVPDPTADPALADVAKAAALAEVVAALAEDLLAKPKLNGDASATSNIKSVKAGSAGVEFFSPQEGAPLIGSQRWDRLASAGLLAIGSDDLDALEGPFIGGLIDDCRPLSGRRRWDWPIAALDYD